MGEGAGIVAAEADGEVLWKKQNAENLRSRRLFHHCATLREEMTCETV